jgi:signal transduction histidine kinase
MPNSKQIKVLLVEDDALDAEFVLRAMRNASLLFSVKHVATLAAAITICQNQTFDLILSDLHLPDSTGFETISQLRCNIANTPIVVLTAVDNVALEKELLDAGAQDYVPKNGISGDFLGRAIRHAIQRHEQVLESHNLLREISASRELLTAKNCKLELLYKQAHDFVDNVSHEFRTPLTVIKEYSSLIREGFVGAVNSEQTRMLAIIENRVEDLNTMVDDMLDSSKIESGLIGAWRKPCSVPDILEHVEATLDRKAHVKGVILTWDIAEELPTLFCDAEKIGRVITNLGINALKFCGNPGMVRVSVYQVANSSDVTFAINDNGAGIESSCLKQIFERFRQLGTTTHSSCKGFGLGLAIAKDLVELNFGQLSVESTLGHGSKFFFTVPVNEPDKVTARFIRLIENSPSCPQLLTLVRAAPNTDGDRNELEDLDEFLNSLCRSNDLLFQGPNQTYLFALTTDKMELQAFLDRAQATWKAINRNRPRGPLPVLDYEYLGTYPIPNEGESAINFVSEFVSDRQVTLV